MDFGGLAGLSVEMMLGIAFVLAFLRLGLAGARAQMGAAEKTWGEIVESLLFAWVVVFLIVRPFWFEPFRIPSGSMLDTLKIGDRIIVTKYPYRFHPPQRGDIVVFKSPPEAGSNEADFVKRLIGLPGDWIEIREGRFYVNGKLLPEPYAPERMVDPPYFSRTSETPSHPYHVPPGHYLMVGDNRAMDQSHDGRFWGYLDEKRIKGKAVAICWPPSRIQRFHSPDYGAAASETVPPEPRK